MEHCGKLSEGHLSLKQNESSSKSLSPFLFLFLSNYHLDGKQWMKQEKFELGGLERYTCDSAIDFGNKSALSFHLQNNTCLRLTETNGLLLASTSKVPTLTIHFVFV